MLAAMSYIEKADRTRLLCLHMDGELRTRLIGIGGQDVAGLRSGVGSNGLIHVGEGHYGVYQSQNPSPTHPYRMDTRVDELNQALTDFAMDPDGFGSGRVPLFGKSECLVVEASYRRAIIMLPPLRWRNRLGGPED